MADGRSYVLDGRNLTRLSPAGAPDPSFGKNGTIEAPWGTEAVVELLSGKTDVIAVVTNGGKNPKTFVEVFALRPDGRSSRRPIFRGSAG